MFSIIPKNKLDDNQLKKITGLGATLGKKLRGSQRLQKAYKKSADFGNKYPSIIVGGSLSLAVLAVCLSAYSFYTATQAPIDTPEQDLGSTLVINPSSHYDDSIRIAKEGINQVFIEAKAISDSIQTLLKKDKLTRDDSIYVVTQGKYLEEITNIIQNKQ